MAWEKNEGGMDADDVRDSAMSVWDGEEGEEFCRGDHNDRGKAHTGD